MQRKKIWNDEKINFISIIIRINNNLIGTYIFFFEQNLRRLSFFAHFWIIYFQFLNYIFF